MVDKIKDKKEDLVEKKAPKVEKLPKEETPKVEKVVKDAPAEKQEKVVTKDSDYKLFNKWNTNIDVEDPGLRPYINLKDRIVPRTAGINQKNRFHKSHMSIIERLALHLMQPGHVGKRHRTSSGSRGGSLEQTLGSIETAFKMIEKKTEKNPVEVFVKAIENAALREEITSIQLGSIMARSAVITSPQRRVDRVLRMIAQGSYKRSYGKKINAAKALSDEIIEAYNNSDKSLAISEKARLENEAEGAR